LIHPDYPTGAEVDEWCDRLLREAEDRPVEAKFLDLPSYTFQLGVRHTSGNRYIAFESPGHDTFYGYWQPATVQPAPILFHLPGYGAAISAHPELVADGFNVLHINPLGYATPEGPSQTGELWPVLPDTVKTRGKHGYVDWLGDAAAAVLWALSLEEVQSERFAFFGTSQGGGTSLLMASIFADRGVKAVAADVPFLTNFPLMFRMGTYKAAFNAMSSAEGNAGEWKALGYIDTLSHAHRLRMPTLVSAGELDTTCPPASVESLFEILPGTRSYVYITGQSHGYTVPLFRLARAWFGLYV